MFPFICYHSISVYVVYINEYVEIAEQNQHELFKLPSYLNQHICRAVSSCHILASYANILQAVSAHVANK